MLTPRLQASWLDIEDPDQLARLRARLDNEDIYAVLERSLAELRQIVRKAGAGGYYLYNGVASGGSLQMYFYSSDGHEMHAKLAFGKYYSERTRRLMPPAAVQALREVICTLVLNCEGMERDRYQASRSSGSSSHRPLRPPYGKATG